MRSTKFLKILSFIMLILLISSFQANAKDNGIYSFGSTVSLITPTPVKLQPGKIHTGVINPKGELWRKAEGPHIIRGVFRVEGENSPVLTIEAGASVLFDPNARIEIGRNSPGGIIARGKPGAEIIFSANTKTPKAGFWGGLWFLENTLQNSNIIENSNILYAGAKNKGAVYIASQGDAVEVLLKNVQITNSLYAGLNMEDEGRLSVESSNVKITGTQMMGKEGGFPIITNIQGSDYIPNGEYKPNALNAVNIIPNRDIQKNTIWRNIGVPYSISSSITVSGEASPTLYIEPGVITLWGKGAELNIGSSYPGHLVADAQTKPSWIRIARLEGGGDWIKLPDGSFKTLWVSKPEGGGEWFPYINNGKRLLWLLKPDGTRDAIAAPDINGTWKLDWDPDTWTSNSIEWAPNSDRGGDWISMTKTDGQEIIISKPENENDWLYIMKPDGNGEWISLPDGTFRSLWISRPEGGGEWISLPDGSFKNLWVVKPEGGGEWKSIDGPKQLASWTSTNKFTILSNGFSAGNANSLGPICALCGQNPSIVFGSMVIRWDSQKLQYGIGDTPKTVIASDNRNLTRAIEAWNGINFKGTAANGSILRGVVVAYTGEGDDDSAGILVEGSRLLIADSLVTQNIGSGIELRGNAQFDEKSTGNYLIGNLQPLCIGVEAIGSIPSGNYYRASIPKNMVPLFNFTSRLPGTSLSSKMATNEDLTNKNSWISVTSDDVEGIAAHSALWKNLGIPYHFETGVVIGGVESPHVTIEAGTKLIFEKDCGIEVGIADGSGTDERSRAGSLIIDGTSDRPVEFSSTEGAEGVWEGITFTQYAGMDSRIGSIKIEFARQPLLFKGNFRPVLPINNLNGNLIIK